MAGRKTVELLFDESNDALLSTLCTGSRGERVRALQNRLIDLRFLDEMADGAFGSSTKAAVTKFQAEAKGWGIFQREPDGLADPDTVRLLNVDLSAYGWQAPEYYDFTPARYAERDLSFFEELHTDGRPQRRSVVRVCQPGASLSCQHHQNPDADGGPGKRRSGGHRHHPAGGGGRSGRQFAGARYARRTDAQARSALRTDDPFGQRRGQCRRRAGSRQCGGFRGTDERKSRADRHGRLPFCQSARLSR